MDWNTIYHLGGLNQAIFYAINHVQFAGWEALMLTGTRLGNFYMAFPMYISIASVILLWRLRLLRGGESTIASANEIGRALLVLAVVALSHVISQEIAEWFKHTYPMPRPYIGLPEGTINKLDIWLSARNDYQSFPSGHSAFAAVLLFGFWPLLNRPLRILAPIIAVWIMISRMALGVHFPVDLVAGFALGTATVFTVRFLFSRVVKPGLV